MVNIPANLMSEHCRLAYQATPETEDRFTVRGMNSFRARKDFERLVNEVRWFEGEQSREGFGPTGKCLVAWIDYYPLIAYVEPNSEEFYPAIMSGHCSCGGSSVAGVMLDMLWRVACDPDGRRDSDSQWLRGGGGKKGFFAFYGADPSTNAGQTMAELLARGNFAPSPAAPPSP